MRFIINIVCFLFLLPLIATAQTYKYIGVENGLSNRRIFDIQKDSIGYMWFLTNEGIDRYNGKDIKHYKLIGENKESSSPIHLGWLYFEEKGKLWVIGKAGRIFQYNQEHDVFNKVYKLPKTPVNISYGYMDHNHRIWLCSRYSIALYDTQTGETHQMPNELKSSITSIEQVDNDHFFMATNKGVRYVKLENEALQIVPLEPLDKIQAQISALHFHQESQRLFIGTFEKGVFAYDIRQQRIIHSNTDLSDVNIARIRPLNRTELLIATEGMGIHKINVNSCISEPYITSSYKSYNEMHEFTLILCMPIPSGKSTDWMVHMLGQAVGGYTNATHGMTLAAVSLPYYRHIMPYGLEKFKRFAVNVWGVDASEKEDREIAEEGLAAMESWMKELGLVMNLSELGVTEEMIEGIADVTIVFDTGYKKLDRTEIIDIFRESLI